MDAPQVLRIGALKATSCIETVLGLFLRYGLERLLLGSFSLRRDVWTLRMGPNPDTNNDGKIDLKDLCAVSKN